MFKLHQSRTRSLGRRAIRFLAGLHLAEQLKTVVRKHDVEGNESTFESRQLRYPGGKSKVAASEGTNTSCRCYFTIEDRHGREMPRETVHFMGPVSPVQRWSLTQRENTAVPYFTSAFNRNNNSNNVNNAATWLSVILADFRRFWLLLSRYPTRFRRSQLLISSWIMC